MCRPCHQAIEPSRLRRGFRAAPRARLVTDKPGLSMTRTPRFDVFARSRGEPRRRSSRGTEKPATRGAKRVARILATTLTRGTGRTQPSPQEKARRSGPSSSMRAGTESASAATLVRDYGKAEARSRRSSAVRHSHRPRRSWRWRPPATPDKGILSYIDGHELICGFQAGRSSSTIAE